LLCACFVLRHSDLSSFPNGIDRLVYVTFTNDRSEVENGVFTIEPPAEATE
jgi:hypothetical protein